MSDYFEMKVAVHLLLVKENQILLLRRKNTGYQDGNYSLVAGHADGREKLRAAMVREAKEETGIDIDPETLELRVISHKRENTDERMAVFFETQQWNGEPCNTEPDKCSDIDWFPIDNLPSNLVPYVRDALHCYRNSINYSEFGW